LNIADDVVTNYGEIVKLLAESLAKPVDWTRTVAFLESRNFEHTCGNQLGTIAGQTSPVRRWY